MGHTSPPSPISLKDVVEIERRLDHDDLCACIFLLYDDIQAALKKMYKLSHNCSSQDAINRMLRKDTEVSNAGPLVAWSMSFARDNYLEENSQGKLLETLLYIKSYWIISYLGRNRRDLEVKYLGAQQNTPHHVDLVRKIIFLMIDDLSKSEWNKLLNLLINEAQQRGTAIPPICRKIPEFFTLCLMSWNLLQIKTEEKKMDFIILIRCLEQIERSDWALQIKAIEDFCNSNKATYELDSENPGTILIFNLVEYNEIYPKRHGSDIDGKKLKDTFHLLGFKVVLFQNPSSADIIPKIREFLKLFCRDAKVDGKQRCFCVAILAHGDENDIWGIDGEYVKLESIRNELRNSETSGLPRLLLTQVCRGPLEALESNHGDMFELYPSALHSGFVAQHRNHDDVIELYPSVQGYAAYRDPIHGSPFIGSFCENILTHGRECDLNEIMSFVRKDIDQKGLHHGNRLVAMTPQLSETRTKRLFLTVPENKKNEAEKLVRKWNELHQLLKKYRFKK